MSVESRMDEFKKVSNNKVMQDVSGRMEGFEKTKKLKKDNLKDKFGALPYGIKGVKPCPQCGEFMEIEEIKEKKAIYLCKNCHQSFEVIL